MSDPDLTPEQEDHVRRLLAEARHEAPVPDDVAARLDRVLAGLAAEQEPAPLAPVVDLAARRRRRNAAALLAGAAAVIVGGFAVGQVLDVDSDDAGTDAGSSLSADRSDAADSADSGDAGAGGGNAPGPTQELAPDAPPTPLELSSASLTADLARQLGKRTAEPAPSAGAGESTAAAQGFPCPTDPGASYGIGELYPAYYDGIPAVLALRPPEGASQRADVLDCTTAAELDSAELPAPTP